VVLSWNNPDDPDFAGVVIRRGLSAPPATVGEGVAPVPGTVLGPQAYRDQSVAVATT
jgi:hypothetical protein